MNIKKKCTRNKKKRELHSRRKKRFFKTRSLGLGERECPRKEREAFNSIGKRREPTIRKFY